MTSDVDVLGAIDGAIDDWATSADAMRWQPAAQTVTPWPEMARAGLRVGLLMQEAMQAFARVCQDVGASLSRFVSSLNAAGITAEGMRKAQRQQEIADRRIRQQLRHRQQRAARRARRSRATRSDHTG